jgi:hypothetical protein
MYSLSRRRDEELILEKDDLTNKVAILLFKELNSSTSFTHIINSMLIETKVDYISEGAIRKMFSKELPMLMLWVVRDPS